jgi:hypothetical protein
MQSFKKSKKKLIVLVVVQVFSTSALWVSPSSYAAVLCAYITLITGKQM